jgi:hypothetical protein
MHVAERMSSPADRQVEQMTRELARLTTIHTTARGYI